MKPMKYYQLTQNDDDSADLYIFGDISSWPSDYYGDKSAWSIVKELKDITAAQINVFINSYGGDVAEGLAIYNVLKNHSAKITTYCTGFACSAASVVFMAGDERVMSPASLLMVHNAWTWGAGNAKELRKLADDIETITKASIEAYKTVATISEEKIKELMDNESWILPEDAVEYGFATKVDAESAAEGEPKQSALQSVINALCKPQEPVEGLIDLDEVAETVAQKVMGRLGKIENAAQELINTAAEMAETTTALLEDREKDKLRRRNSGWNDYFN